MNGKEVMVQLYVLRIRVLGKKYFGRTYAVSIENARQNVIDWVYKKQGKQRPIPKFTLKPTNIWFKVQLPGMVRFYEFADSRGKPRHVVATNPQEAQEQAIGLLKGTTQPKVERSLQRCCVTAWPRSARM